VIVQSVCTSFKVELLKGIHDLTPTTGDTIMLALYGSSASLGPETTAYTASGEVSGAGYVAGGITVTTVDPTSSGTVAIADIADATFTSVSLTARGALLYNASKANRAICVLDFGVDRTKSGEDFVVTFPLADSMNAVLRIS